MCSRVTCRKCGKPTWAGCGAHIEMVLGNVPQDKRCKCRARRRSGYGDVLASLMGGTGMRLRK